MKLNHVSGIEEEDAGIVPAADTTPRAAEYLCIVDRGEPRVRAFLARRFADRSDIAIIWDRRGSDRDQTQQSLDRRGWRLSVLLSLWLRGYALVRRESPGLKHDQT